MNGKYDEYERLKLIERGIDPDTGGKLNPLNGRQNKENSGVEVVVDTEMFCTRWGTKVPMIKVFSGTTQIS